MVRYSHTQTAGWPYLIMVFSGGTLIFIALLPEPMPVAVRVALVAGAGFLTWLMLVFRRLTVEITHDIALWFGWGWPRKRIDPATIVSQRVVQNPWWYGWGIRTIPRGTLWNVSGLAAVELALTDGKVFRIGTDDPDMLWIALAGMIGRA